MQSEEYHNTYGRGRNISCSNFNCENYNKKIGRKRGFFAPFVDSRCPICNSKVFVHQPECKVIKNNVIVCGTWNAQRRKTRLHK